MIVRVVHPTRSIAEALKGSGVPDGELWFVADQVMGALMADGWIDEREVRQMEPLTKGDATDG